MLALVLARVREACQLRTWRPELLGHDPSRSAPEKTSLMLLCTSDPLTQYLLHRDQDPSPRREEEVRRELDILL